MLASLIEELTVIVGLFDAVTESKMDPFKRRSKIGPGPYGYRNAKRKRDRFKCRCSSRSRGVMCKCRSRSTKKSVYISYDYKKSYNAAYRGWVSKRRKSKVKKKRLDFQTRAKIG